jgi:hypothetical protein
MISSFTQTDTTNKPLTEWLMMTDHQRAHAAPPSSEILNKERQKKEASRTGTFEITQELLLSATQRQRCMEFMDKARKTRAPGCSDMKITLGNSIGRGGEIAFAKLFDLSLSAAKQQYDGLMATHPYDSKIALRRTEGPVDGCIDFHCDGGYASSTVQIALNDDSEYEGGRICFVTGDGVLSVPSRVAGTLTRHKRDILHGVTPLHRGVRN